MFVCHEYCTCDQFSDFHVSGLSKQANQSRNPSTVLQGYFVLIVGLAVHQIPQGSTGTAVNLTHPVVQQIDQQLNASLSTDLGMKDTISIKKKGTGFLPSYSICQPCKSD